MVAFRVARVVRLGIRQHTSRDDRLAYEVPGRPYEILSRDGVGGRDGVVNQTEERLADDTFGSTVVYRGKSSSSACFIIDFN